MITTEFYVSHKYSFLKLLLRNNSHVTLYYFQVYNLMIQYINTSKRTQLSLVNIKKCQHKYLSYGNVKINSVSNFQIYNPVLLTTVTMLHILYSQGLFIL